MSGDTEASSTSGRRSASPRRANKRSLLAIAIVAVLMLTGGSLAFTASEASARSQLDTVTAAFNNEKAAANETLQSAQSVRNEAETVWDESAGRVLTEDARSMLAAAIDAVDARIGSAEDVLTTADQIATSAVAADDGSLIVGAALRQAASTLEEFDFPDLGSLTELTDSLAEPQRAVLEAVAAWQTEQDRIAASRYTNRVHAVGWTPELDECVGSVDISAHYDDIPTIAEHWSCGGRLFPDESGTVIQLTGEIAGTYRVEGIVKMVNQHIATVADVPRGYDLLYQTCQNGQSTTMSFTALTRIE